MAGDAIGPIGEITAKKIIGAFPAEGYGCFCFAEYREEPDRQSTSIGTRLIGMVCELFDCPSEVHAGIQIEFIVLGAIFFDGLANVGGFIKAPACEGDRKSLQA